MVIGGYRRLFLVIGDYTCSGKLRQPQRTYAHAAVITPYVMTMITSLPYMGQVYSAVHTLCMRVGVRVFFNGLLCRRT